MASDLAAHLEFFAALGVSGVSRDPRWRERQEPALVAAASNSAADDVSVMTALAADEQEMSGEEGLETAGAELAAHEALDQLRTDIGPLCVRCKLCNLGRRQVVFGVGNPRARLMFVGEAPGEDEDRQGEPFVGRAGQLLTRIIEAINLTRDQVYIANVIKCRPPGNRNPEPDEVSACEPFLFRQLELIKPRVVVALGKFAAQCLLRSTDPITRLRGREFEYRGATLIPTFHPAYLLRNPSAKREVWEDMKKVRAILLEDASAR